MGEGVGSEGWLPDRGGAWRLTYWSPGKPGVLEVTVDTDGRLTTAESPTSPSRGKTLPHEWMDSPRVWAATRAHLKGTPINTFAAELAFDAPRAHDLSGRQPGGGRRHPGHALGLHARVHG